MSVDSSQTTYASKRSTTSRVAWGVSMFAGVMLGTVAVFQILEAIAAIAEDDIYVSGISYTYKFDVTAWGWIHLALGVVALGTAIGIVLGQFWSYALGIAIAVLSALANFAFIPHYPIWSIIVITFDILVVWALCQRMTRSDAM